MASFFSGLYNTGKNVLANSAFANPSRTYDRMFGRSFEANTGEGLNRGETARANAVTRNKQYTPIPNMSFPESTQEENLPQSSQPNARTISRPGTIGEAPKPVQQPDQPAGPEQPPQPQTQPGPTSGGGDGGGGQVGSLTDEQQNAYNVALQEEIGEGSTPQERANLILEQREQDRQERLREVEQMFGGTQDILNEQKGIYEGERERMLNQANQGFETQEQRLQRANEQAQRQLGLQRQNQMQGFEQQLGGVRQQEQSALDDARRLYNEVQMGNRQRFGGSQVGQFISGLQQRELARQMGDIRGTAGQNVQNIQQERQQIQRELANQELEIQENFQDKMQLIESERQNNLGEAQRLFSERLSAINNARIQNEQAKREARAQALQDLRNQARQIQQQYTQFKQGIQQQFNQANLQLRNAVAAFQTENAQPIDLSGIPQAQMQGIPMAQFTTPTGGAVAPGMGANVPYGTLRRDQDNNQPLAPIGNLRPDEDQNAAGLR